MMNTDEILQRIADEKEYYSDSKSHNRKNRALAVVRRHEAIVKCTDAEIRRITVELGFERLFVC